MMKKNLGGDRLGSGAKNNVELHEWHKSTHDLSKVTRTTMAAGTLIPIYREFAQQGDIWDIELDALINTHPTEGPLFGSFKLQVDVFTAPIRLYLGKLHMNMLKEGTDMRDIKLPRIHIEAAPIDWTKEDVSNQQINPSSIAAYLGIRGLGNSTGPTGRSFNAIPFLMYYEIGAQYYANQQEEVAYMIHNGLNLGITGVAVISNAGTDPIPAAPATNAVALIGGDLPRVEIGVAGNVQPEDIYVNTSAGRRQLTTLFSNVKVIADNVLSFDLLKSSADGTYIFSYEPIDVRTSLPQMYSYNLSEINEIKMDILADVRNPNAYSISGTTNIEPYKSILKAAGGKQPLTSSQEDLEEAEQMYDALSELSILKGADNFDIAKFKDMCKALDVNPDVAARVIVAVAENRSGLTLTFDKPTEENVAKALKGTASEAVVCLEPTSEEVNVNKFSIAEKGRLS